MQLSNIINFLEENQENSLEEESSSSADEDYNLSTRLKEFQEMKFSIFSKNK